MSSSSEPLSTKANVPETPTSSDVVTISQTSIYFLLVGFVCFVAGFAVAWVMLSSSTNFASLDVQNARATGIAEGVSSTQNESAAAVPGQARQVNIDLNNSPSWGSANAKVTIIEYSDFECPFCGRFYNDTYGLIKTTYGNRVRYVFKHFPLEFHPDAVPAALASECAREQGKFWEFHDLAFRNQGNLSHDALILYAQQAGVANIGQFTQCFDSRKYMGLIQASYNEGLNVGVTGTPTFLVNGSLVVGAQPFSVFQQVIDRALASAGG